MAGVVLTRVARTQRRALASKRGSRKPNVNGEVNMASGLYVMQDGSVMVAYGTRRIAISCAQYKVNGYKPALEKLAKSPSGRMSPATRPEPRFAAKAGTSG